MTKRSLVVLSGGQDSSTCCAIAQRHHGDEVHAITFNYGQKHSIEIESAIAVGQALNVTSHEVINLGADILKGTSPLISGASVDTFETEKDLPDGIANTFIPSRNALFVTIASNRAIVMGIDTILTGVCECDYSGYPDCRRVFIDAMEDAISLGNFGEKGKFNILTPLMSLTKADTVRLAHDLLGSDKFDHILGLTHTCYQGVKGGCGYCAACLLRDKGFIEANIPDPLWKLRRNLDTTITG